MSVLDLFRLEGRRALVTGGSRGLGRAMARAFAEAGADLVLTGRTPESLEEARAELSALGRKVDVVVHDLSTGEGAEQLCTLVLEEHGPIDILVNNVGGRREDVPTEDMHLEKWRSFLELNLNNAFVCTKRIGGAMLPRGWGRVINVASIAGPWVSMRNIAGRHYETAKSALVGFTRAVAADWAPRGVTVNAIAPGGFLTDPNRRWFRERPSFRKEFEERVPMGRLGQPEEVGPLALYLASEASRYMTGAVLPIDGGYTLW
jgi:NAD(P)-dependent dehydrogenase (short-subunit alcohol dehydrogenase family)